MSETKTARPKRDPELIAMERVQRLTDTLTPDQAVRVLQWASMKAAERQATLTLLPPAGDA